MAVPRGREPLRADTALALVELLPRVRPCVLALGPPPLARRDPLTVRAAVDVAEAAVRETDDDNGAPAARAWFRLAPADLLGHAALAAPHHAPEREDGTHDRTAALAACNAGRTAFRSVLKCSPVPRNLTGLGWLFASAVFGAKQRVALGDARRPAGRRIS